MNLTQLTDEQLLRHLHDSELEVQRGYAELRRRADLRYPGLFDAIGNATRKALSIPSMFQRAIAPLDKESLSMHAPVAPALEGHALQKPKTKKV